MSDGVHVVLLAAGRSSRTGSSHKLLATIDGEPILRHSARTALGSSANGTIVVLGHRAEEMRAALAGLSVRIVENAGYANGLSTSLIAGFAALPPEASGALVMLADQPRITSGDLDRLIAAFHPAGEGALVVSTDNGQRFNPVVISGLYRDEINDISGDVGARKLFARHSDAVREVEIGPAASFDVDTLEALHEAGALNSSSV